MFTEALHFSSACTTLTRPSVHATISSVLLSCLTTNVLEETTKVKISEQQYDSLAPRFPPIQTFSKWWNAGWGPWTRPYMWM